MGDVYSQLAERHGYAGSARYRAILEYLMTPEQAQIAAALPTPAEELAQRLNMDVEKVRLELDYLFRKGVVFPKNYQTLEGCRFARNALQLHDATQSGLRLDPERHRRLFELWEDFLDNEFYLREAAEWQKREQSSSRVVPAYRAVKDKPGLLPDEDVRELVGRARTIAVVSCSCRKRKQAVGHPCARSHHATCLQLNRGAEYAIARGSGTRLSPQEAMELIDEVEADGLVHEFYNATVHGAYDFSTVMCHCCPDCCVNLLPMKRFAVEPTRVYAKSRYEARVEQNLCNGCQVCIERCPFEAIDMMKPEGSKKLKAVVNAEKCMGCGVCVLTCEPGALSLRLVRPAEHIPQLRRT